MKILSLRNASQLNLARMSKVNNIKRITFKQEARVEGSALYVYSESTMAKGRRFFLMQVSCLSQPRSLMIQSIFKEDIALCKSLICAQLQN